VSSQFWWYVARASGIVAWALASLSVIWGLLLSTRLLDRKPSPRWLLDLHRYLGGLTVVFVGLHLTALVADTFVHFGAADLFVPFASAWRTGAVAWGVGALYLLVAVEVTSLMMKHLSRKAWHGVHLASYVLFWMTAIHGATAGTDAPSPIYVTGSISSIIAVVFLTMYRILVGKRALGRRSSRQAATAGVPSS
jgi:sulfoxide reductase heme-binding subunit YedZ